MHSRTFTLFICVFVTFACSANDSISNRTQMWQLFGSDLTLEEVTKLPITQWKDLSNNHTSVNVFQEEYWHAANGHPIWIKLKLPRITNTDRIWIELSPNVGLDGKIATKKNGIWSWNQPAGRRASDAPGYPASLITFMIEDPREHREVFLKIYSSQIAHFSINIRTDEEQTVHLANSNLFCGIVFGLLILAIVYNMVTGIYAGEKLYIYYSSYVLSTLLYIISMTSYTRYVFPEWGDSGNFSNLTVLLAMLTAILFVSELLETKRTSPSIDRLLKMLQILIVGGIFLVGFVSNLIAYAVAEVLGTIVPIAVLTAGTSAFLKRHPLAKFFLIAWSFFIVTSSAWAWMWLGFIAPSDETLNLFILGTVVEVLLLSLLLGYRYAELKQITLTINNERDSASLDPTIDHLSGVLNRQSLYKDIKIMLKSAKNELIWIEIDIDDFHKFNLKFGEAFGDKLLNEFGELLKTKVRRDNLAAKLIDKENSFSYRRGVVGRTGGGKFTLLLSNCSMPQARLYCERIIKDFSSIKLKTGDAKWVNATISMAVILVMPGEKFDSAWKRSQAKLDELNNEGEKEQLYCQ